MGGSIFTATPIYSTASPPPWIIEFRQGGEPLDHVPSRRGEVSSPPSGTDAAPGTMPRYVARLFVSDRFRDAQPWPARPATGPPAWPSAPSRPARRRRPSRGPSWQTKPASSNTMMRTPYHSTPGRYGDGLPDIVISNKKGTFLFEQVRTKKSPGPFSRDPKGSAQERSPSGFRRSIGWDDGFAAVVRGQCRQDGAPDMRGNERGRRRRGNGRRPDGDSKNETCCTGRQDAQA